MLKLRTFYSRQCVRQTTKASYSSAKDQEKLKLSDPNLLDHFKIETLDLGKFREVMRSGSLEKYDALAKELTALHKQDKLSSFLNSDAKEILKEFADNPHNQALVKSLLDRLEKEAPQEVLKSFDFVRPRNPDYNKRVIDSFVNNYTELYGTLKAFSPEGNFPPSYYQLPAKQQQAWKGYRESVAALNKQFVEKYGDKATPILNRQKVFSDLAQGLVYPNKIPTEPIRVAVTGASGQIGYALAFRIASGGLFGPGVPVILHLLELPQAMSTLQGVIMELQDCAFPCLKGIVATDSAERAFDGVDWALLVGASPRTKGMERADLLLKNAEIFATQGKALNSVGKRDNTRVVVVGNPANTNALIAQQNAPNIPAKNFSAMTRLDHNRGLSQLSSKLGVHVDDISNFVIWGNHSATQFPDISYATVPVSLSTGLPVAGNKPGLHQDNIGLRLVSDLVQEDWVNKDFIPTVQQRGAAIIAARGSSSAQSAASSCLDAVHDWDYGTNLGWTSAAVVSNGEYGVEKGLFFSYPVVYSGQQWDIVKHLPIDEYQATLMEKSHQELLQERDAVVKFLPKTTASSSGDSFSI